MRWWISMMIVALFATSACSFIGVRGPSQISNGQPVDCTDSRTLPIVDTVPAVLGGLLAVGDAAFASYCEWGDGGFCAKQDAGFVLAGDLAPLVVGTAYLASAIHGYRAVSRCREARRPRR
jgi:hypothetical protein